MRGGGSGNEYYQLGVAGDMTDPGDRGFVRLGEDVLYWSDEKSEWTAGRVVGSQDGGFVVTNSKSNKVREGLVPSVDILQIFKSGEEVEYYSEEGDTDGEWILAKVEDFFGEPFVYYNLNVKENAHPRYIRRLSEEDDDEYYQLTAGAQSKEIPEGEDRGSVRRGEYVFYWSDEYSFTVSGRVNSVRKNGNFGVIDSASSMLKNVTPDEIFQIFESGEEVEYYSKGGDTDGEWIHATVESFQGSPSDFRFYDLDVGGTRKDGVWPANIRRTRKPTPEPAPQPAPQPTPEPAPQPAPKPAPQPAPQPAPRPARKPARKPAPASEPRSDLDMRAFISPYNHNSQGANVESPGSTPGSPASTSGSSSASTPGSPVSSPVSPVSSPGSSANLNYPSYPATWSTVAENVDGRTTQVPYEGLVEVMPSSPEYWEISDQLRAPTESGRGQMNDAWISELWRVQNPQLFRYFEFHKDRFKDARRPDMLQRTDTGSRLKVETVWHGTGNFPAHNIYTDKSDGFMMQYASDGQWGRGLYFAKDAGYCDAANFASRYGTEPGPGLRPLAADEREVLRASLLLGRVVVMDRDNVPGMKERLGGRLNVPPGPDGKIKPGLVAPPFLNSTPPLHSDGSGPKFNTVSGWTQSDIQHPDGTWSKNPACPRSKVWIVYENGRAYPDYLVRYYRGPRDPARTPFASLEEARISGATAKRARMLAIS